MAAGLVCLLIRGGGLYFSERFEFQKLAMQNNESMMSMVLLMCAVLPPRYTSTRSNKVIEINQVPFTKFLLLDNVTQIHQGGRGADSAAKRGRDTR